MCSENKQKKKQSTIIYIKKQNINIINPYQDYKSLKLLNKQHLMNFTQLNSINQLFCV